MENDLDLNRRSALPDALYALRREFPREGWQTHANFSDLVAFWMERHMMFRQICETLRQDAEAVQDGKLDPQRMRARLSRYGSMLLQQLHAHHQIEDHHYFPLLIEREGSLSRGFEILDKDHHAMDGLLNSFATSANGVLQQKAEVGGFRDEVSAFQSLLLRHLEDEEDLVVPILLKHGSAGFG